MQGQNYSVESRSLGSSRSGWCLSPICATGVVLGIAKATSECFLCYSGFPILSIDGLKAKQAPESVSYKHLG